MAKILNVFKKIEDLQKRYVHLAQKGQSLLTLILETEVAEHVYNSNAIENSTLSLDETEKILLQIDLDRFISERELFEAKNLARVLSYIQTKSKEKELELDVILLLHQMLVSNIRDDIAGRFRGDGEWVKVANHIACDPAKIEDKLQIMLNEYYASPMVNIIKRIARFHLSFEYMYQNYCQR